METGKGEMEPFRKGHRIIQLCPENPSQRLYGNMKKHINPKARNGTDPSSSDVNKKDLQNVTLWQAMYSLKRWYYHKLLPRILDQLQFLGLSLPHVNITLLCFRNYRVCFWDMWWVYHKCIFFCIVWSSPNSKGHLWYLKEWSVASWFFMLWECPLIKPFRDI